ncbi:MAG: heme-degrading domain-containing protein [Microbacteriaceae bacterium]
MSSELLDLIAQIEEQESRLQFSRFTNADAWHIGSQLVTRAVERSLGITIDITTGDQQIFHAATAGTSADNDDWVARKVRTVRRFATSSFLVGRRHAAAGTDFNEQTGLPISLYAAHGGGFPVIIRNAGLIGTITVSGLPQADDHALVVEVIEEFLAHE